MDFEQDPLVTEGLEKVKKLELEWFCREASSKLWSNFISYSFHPVFFTFLYCIIDMKLPGTAVFSNVFALCLRGTLIVRIRNAFEYQKMCKSYIASGVVFLLWSMYALYSSGYSFFVILPSCIVIPGLLAYYFRGRFMNMQAVYLAYLGYNSVLFFLLFFLFALQSFLVFFHFLLHLVALSYLIISLAEAIAFLKQGDAQRLIYWRFPSSMYRAREDLFVLGTVLYTAVYGAIEIPKGSASLFDVRFMFYAIMVCSFAEEFLFRIYTKMWDKLMRRRLAPLGRLIN